MNINKLLNIKYPILQGGMANIGTAEFAATVSNAGGLGVIASGGLKPEKLREEIMKVKTLTDKPYGVNLMLLNPFADEMAQMLSELEVPVITTGAGNPSKYMEMWKESGAVILPVISSPTMAKKVEKLGADGVIAEGAEAGGHIGEMTTMTLIPQVKDAVNIPVIAAGGIASGKQMLASEILGADGIQIGTILLASDECPIHDNYKEKIIKSKDTNVTVIGRIGGLSTRVLRNNMTNEYILKEKDGWDKLRLEVFTVGALSKAVYHGDIVDGSVMAGLVVGQVNEIKPVKDVIESLYFDYEKEMVNIVEKSKNREV